MMPPTQITDTHICLHLSECHGFQLYSSDLIIHLWSLVHSGREDTGQEDKNGNSPILEPSTFECYLKKEESVIGETF